MVYALIVYVDCELFYRLTFGHKKRDPNRSLNCSKRRERDSNPRYLAVRRFSRPLQSTTLPSLRKVVQRYTTFFNYAIGYLKIFVILFAMVDIEWWPMKPTHLWFECRCLTLIDLVCHVRIQQSIFLQAMCMKYPVYYH